MPKLPIAFTEVVTYLQLTVFCLREYQAFLGSIIYGIHECILTERLIGGVCGWGMYDILFWYL